jgi:hypothetical protein
MFSSVSAEVGSADRRQHVLAIEHVPHRYLSAFVLIGPGIIAAVFGTCQHIWQILLLRSLSGVIGLGGIQAVIMGEVVDKESTAQGQS